MSTSLSQFQSIVNVTPQVACTDLVYVKHLLMRSKALSIHLKSSRYQLYVLFLSQLQKLFCTILYSLVNMIHCQLYESVPSDKLIILSTVHSHLGGCKYGGQLDVLIQSHFKSLSCAPIRLVLTMLLLHFYAVIIWLVVQAYSVGLKITLSFVHETYTAVCTKVVGKVLATISKGSLGIRWSTNFNR